MSDPQTNIEIEDVLASIRRLVSDGDVGTASRPLDDSMSTKPRQATVEVPVSAPAPSANTPAAPDKLVLSPDQMVEQPTAPLNGEVIDNVASEPFVLAPNPTAPDATVVAGPGASDAAPVVEFRSLAGQDGSESEADLPDVPEDQPAETVSDARRQLLSTIAELEAAVTTKTDDFEPDGSEQTPVVDWAATTSNGAIFGARAATTRITEVEHAAMPEAANLEAGPVADDVPPSDEVVAAIEVEAETASLADADTVEEPQDTEVEERDEDEAALAEFLSAEAAMEEGALRELVTEIVRQELQGALGERITRNVRKLVRREIYRALASEEFN